MGFFPFLPPNYGIMVLLTVPNWGVDSVHGGIVNDWGWYTGDGSLKSFETPSLGPVESHVFP